MIDDTTCIHQWGGWPVRIKRLVVAGILLVSGCGGCKSLDTPKEVKELTDQNLDLDIYPGSGQDSAQQPAEGHSKGDPDRDQPRQ